MISLNGFSNATKIETVNAKLATSILTELITKLVLLQSAERADSQTNNEFKDTTSPTTTKFTTDVANMIDSFHKIISDLKEHQNFTDFSGISVAKNEVNFLTEYSLNKTKLKELSDAFVRLEEDIVNYRKPIATVDESILQCAIQNRFIKTWEKARRDQNDHFNRMLIDSLQNVIDDYTRKIELEQRCMVDIESYSLSEMDMHKAESTRWTEKFDVDINKTEIDIQVAASDLERMKLSHVNTIDTIRFREQEMIDFVALKEERALQKDSDLMKLIYAHRDHLFAKCQIFSELI